MNIKIKKYIFIILIAVVLISTIVVGTISYLNEVDNTKNSFDIGTVIPTIIQDYNVESNIRENVRIKNTGNFPIYVRVALIYYFKNSSDEIIEEVPSLDVDYSILFSDSLNWIKHSDGYYYYKLILEPEENTDNLIDKCLELKSDLNKKFGMDIIVQAIQAYPSKAAQESWKINIVDNMISIE